MTNFDIDRCLESMTLLIDSREQPTERQQARLDIIGLPYRRCKLNVGDYSCSCSKAVNKLATNMENMVEEQKKQGERLQAIESRDGEMWRKVVSYAVTAVIGVVIGFLLKQVGIF